MIVVGSGAIGTEFAYFYNSIGTKVTIVEFLPKIVPVEDEDISKELEKIFKKQGINIMTNSEVVSVEVEDDSFLYSFSWYLYPYFQHLLPRYWSLYQFPVS